MSWWIFTSFTRNKTVKAVAFGKNYDDDDTSTTDVMSKRFFLLPYLGSSRHTSHTTQINGFSCKFTTTSVFPLRFYLNDLSDAPDMAPLPFASTTMSGGLHHGGRRSAFGSSSSFRHLSLLLSFVVFWVSGFFHAAVEAQAIPPLPAFSPPCREADLTPTIAVSECRPIAGRGPKTRPTCAQVIRRCFCQHGIRMKDAGVACGGKRGSGVSSFLLSEQLLKLSLCTLSVPLSDSRRESN